MKLMFLYPCDKGGVIVEQIFITDDKTIVEWVKKDDVKTTLYDGIPLKFMWSVDNVMICIDRDYNILCVNIETFEKRVSKLSHGHYSRIEFVYRDGDLVVLRGASDIFYYRICINIKTGETIQTSSREKTAMDIYSVLDYNDKQILCLSDFGMCWVDENNKITNRLKIPDFYCGILFYNNLQIIWYNYKNCKYYISYVGDEIFKPCELDIPSYISPPIIYNCNRNDYRVSDGKIWYIEKPSNTLKHVDWPDEYLNYDTKPSREI